MKKVRLGIIGIGNMGSSHSKRVSNGEIDGMILVAVADQNEGRREWAQKNLPNEVVVFEQGEELIESGLCDAILIATPHYQHPELSMKSFENGLHVLCEKPVGVYTKQVAKMNQEASKHDLVFGMMFNQRMNPVYRKMYELVHSGELGAIKRVNWIVTTWYRTQSYYDSGLWRATWAGEGGGVLLNQCPHNLDLIQWICGMPSKVQAFCHNGKWHDIEVEDDVTAYMEYPNGATGVFVTSTADTPGTNRFEITLEMGKLVCEDDQLVLYKLAQNEREFCKSAVDGFSQPEVTRIDIKIDEENLEHNGIIQSFTNSILSGTKLVAEGKEGINGLTLSNAMHLSSWLSKPVELPLDEDLFLDELNKRIAASKEKTTEAVYFDTEGSY